ncbi:MAG TPA: hypothetical protein VGI40_10530 [Pirellulaceae bacterium]|jgi:hypothetical protein
MISGDSLGTLVLSIHLELDLEDQNRRDEQRLDEIRARLIDLTKTSGVSATWAVADPMLSVASESILSAGVGHEVAVLGDEAWLGQGCGRGRLARELARRFSAPRKNGLSVSTLMLRNMTQVGDFDLLIQHGVTAISGPATSQGASTQKAMQPPTRFGIWQPPIALRLPMRSKWWSPATWNVRREIKRTIRKRTVLHLSIDAPRLIGDEDRSLDLVASILRYSAAKRDAGQLSVATIGQLASKALDARAGNPSRSILRPAA